MNASWLEAVGTVGGRRPRALVAGAFVKSLWLCESEMHCDTRLAILHRVPRLACHPASSCSLLDASLRWILMPRITSAQVFPRRNVIFTAAGEPGKRPARKNREAEGGDPLKKAKPQHILTSTWCRRSCPKRTAPAVSTRWKGGGLDRWCVKMESWKRQRWIVLMK